MRETRAIFRYFSTKRIKSINSLIIEFNSAAEAQKIAEKAVDEKEFSLNGVKTNPWRQLFEAAEKYSTTIAYPNEEFPVTSENARCVLCMQTLDVDAKQRMLTFKDFILDEVGTRLKKVRSEIENISSIFDRYHIRILKDVELHISDLPKDLYNISEEITEFFTAYHGLLKNIQNNIKNRTPIVVSSAPEISYKQIFTWLKGIKKQISEYETLKNPEEVQKHQNAYNELFSQKLVHENIQVFKKFVTISQEADKYTTAINALDTTKISKKGRTLISEECTPELQACLQKEFDNLGIRNIEIAFKPRGSKGVTLHEFEFQGAVARQLLSKVLSEGEQKAVALAGFFAELSLAKHTCPIVLDDPVTSLDHIYREKIAQRIAIESSSRQVIVFTHDIVFLHEIEKHLGRISGNLSVITLKKVGTIPGKVFSTLPWHAMKVKGRLGYLEQIIPTFAKLYEDDLPTYSDKAAHWYNLFRETWEAIVEEQMLAGVVERFCCDVKTLKLGMVDIADDDYRTQDLYMSKASEWMYGHNKSRPQSVNRPTPNEIREDLANTRSFVKQISSRNDKNQKRRKELLKPQQTSIG